jgi:hypothetical protein
MAYNIKDVFFLDAKLASGTVTGEGVASLDVSSYVQAVTRSKTKPFGLAVYKVHWDIADKGGNGPVAAASTGTFRSALFAGSGLTQAAVGSATLIPNYLNAANDLCISGVDFWAGATAAGDPPPHVWLEPSTDVPYVVVRDTIQLIYSADVAMSADSYVYVRMECAIVTLDSATMNQLLRTQTV